MGIQTTTRTFLAALGQPTPLWNSTSSTRRHLNLRGQNHISILVIAVSSVSRSFSVLLLLSFCYGFTHQKVEIFISAGFYELGGLNCTIGLLIPCTTSKFFRTKYDDFYNVPSQVIASSHALLTSTKLSCVLLVLLCLPEASAAGSVYECHRWYAVCMTSLLMCGDMKPNPGPARVQQPTGSAHGRLQLASHDGALLRIIPTAVNRHCFIHALHVSMATFLFTDLSCSNLLRQLRNEVIVNEETYMSFLPATLTAFRAQVSSYFDSKNYNTDFGDLLQLTAANAFKLQIVITQSPYFKLKDCLIVSPSGTFTLTNIPFIVLHSLH